VMLYFGNS